MDPGFTMRRKMEHLREEREQIRQLRNVCTIVYDVGAVCLVCTTTQTFVIKTCKSLWIYKSVSVVTFLSK